MSRNELLIQCYLSSQIHESDWQRLLDDEPGLREEAKKFFVRLSTGPVRHRPAATGQ